MICSQITFYFNIYLTFSEREDHSYVAVSYTLSSFFLFPILYWHSIKIFSQFSLEMLLIASATHSTILYCFEDFYSFMPLSSNSLAFYLSTCFKTFNMLVTLGFSKENNWLMQMWSLASQNPAALNGRLEIQSRVDVPSFVWQHSGARISSFWDLRLYGAHSNYRGQSALLKTYWFKF